ncbi:hypothetical protein IFM51744_08934, partial [Aspergillus udagawae]
TEPSHSTKIIPNILPEPSLSTTREDFLERMHQMDVKAALTTFFSLKFARGRQETVTLTSQLVKRYMLANPAHYFQNLMTMNSWKYEQVIHHAEGANLTAPVVEVAGIVGTPGLVDPSINVRHLGHNRNDHSRQVLDEGIFAIAYCELKLKHYFDENTPRLIKKDPVIGQAKRAKAYHLALGDSKEEVPGSSDDECLPGRHDVQLVDQSLLTSLGLYEKGEFEIN